MQSEFAVVHFCFSLWLQSLMFQCCASEKLSKTNLVVQMVQGIQVFQVVQMVHGVQMVQVVQYYQLYQVLQVHLS